MIVPIEINLTLEEMLHATEIATRRQVYNYQVNAKPKYGEKGNGWERNIEGCICEKALSMFLGRNWPGPLGDYSAPDVAPCYEIRGTTYAEGRLLLHPPDRLYWPHTLGRLDKMKVTLVGWAFGWEVKHQKYFKALQPNRLDGECYVFPNEFLRDMSTLPEPFEVLDATVV